MDDFLRQNASKHVLDARHLSLSVSFEIVGWSEIKAGEDPTTRNRLCRPSYGRRRRRAVRPQCCSAAVRGGVQHAMLAMNAAG